MILNSVLFKASPSQQRVEKLLSIGEEFLSSRIEPGSSWQVLLGTLSSLSSSCRSSLDAVASADAPRSWDQVEDSTLIRWDDHCLHDLLWWLDPVCLQEGVSLTHISPDLDFWSDTSVVTVPVFFPFGLLLRSLSSSKIRVVSRMIQYFISWSPA